jgi:hypothetical protein
LSNFSELEQRDERFIDPIPPFEFQLAFKIISGEFEKAKRAHAARRCPGDGNVVGCRLIVLSERYAIDTESDPYKPPIFFLIDILHNEKR